MFKAPLVMDCGGYNCRIGSAGSDAPDSKFRSIISLDDQSVGGTSRREGILSKQDISNSDDTTFKSPIERGFIVDWDGMEKVWEHAFKSINCDSRDHSVLLTDAMLNPKTNRERMIQVLFESFGVPYGFISLEPVLNVYSCGTTTALSLVMGDGTSQILPMIQGQVISTGLFRTDLGGSDVTLSLWNLLEENGKLELNQFTREDANTIKENYCDCSMGDGSEIVYMLPDGGTVTIGDETKRAANLLFDTSVICCGELSIPDLISKSFDHTEMDLRWLLYNNIVVAGGNSLMKNFTNELRHTLKNRFPQHNCKVVAAPEREYSTWIGGSILASLSSFQNVWISHKAYDDYGPNIVFRSN